NRIVGRAIVAAGGEGLVDSQQFLEIGGIRLEGIPAVDIIEMDDAAALLVFRNRGARHRRNDLGWLAAVERPKLGDSVGRSICPGLDQRIRLVERKGNLWSVGSVTVLIAEGEVLIDLAIDQNGFVLPLAAIEEGILVVL